MKVISFKICPFVQRVVATLVAKNISFDIEYIDLGNPPKWFLEISPKRQVPLLITDNNTVLFESDAIVEYIDEINDPLQANLCPEGRAINRAYCILASSNYLLQCSLMQSNDSNTLADNTAKFNNVLEVINNALDDKPYFKSNTIGNVDLAWLVILHRFAIIKENTNVDFLAKFPKISNWQENILKTNIANLSVANDYLAEFKGFYLSDRTYLGRGQKPLQGNLTKQNTSGCCG